MKRFPGRPGLSRGGRRLAACLLVLGTAALAGTAEAQLRSSRLNNDTCLAEDFTAFDDVIMTATAAHFSGAGDVYQAICDAEDCFGFSINRGAQVNAMTTGITAGEYTWFVCAWNGSVRSVVANLSGGAVIFMPARSPEPAGTVLALADPRVPEQVRRFASRLGRVPVARQ